MNIHKNIQKSFLGSNVTALEWFHSNKTTNVESYNQVYVTFESAHEIESAIKIMGRLLKNKFVKVFRSSAAQLKYFRNKRDEDNRSDLSMSTLSLSNTGK